VSATARPAATAASEVPARASRDVLRIAMVIVAILGIALASYLTYIHYEGIKPVCTAGQACIKVQSSVWSKIGGVPVALIGLIGYVGIFFSLLAPDLEETRLATLGMTLIGFGFSAYLTYREIFSIHAICEECVTSFVLIAILLACAVARYLRGAGEIHSVATKTSPEDHE
jgi:uncharacterized membrane protein